MADCLEVVKERKKRTFKKADVEFGFFEDTMRTPSSYIGGKRSNYKGSFHNTHNDDSNNFWEKKSSRRHHGDDYRGGSKAWRYENSKEALQNDVGRPPGEGNDTDSTPIVAPVILARERNNTTEPKTSIPNKGKDAEPAKPAAPSSSTPSRSYQIASKINSLEGSVIPDLLMTNSVKLLDDSLHLGDDLSAYLLDQKNFLVMAVVGLQASGKSTIASFLADPMKVDDLTATNSFVFHPESKDEVLRGCHSTSGVDAFITKDRIIILDLQPLLSPSVMDYIVTQERKASLDFSSTENLLEIESLQLLTFAMSIAHVLMVVQDYILHPNLLRLLHTCQMMKPSSSSSSGSSSSNREGSSRLPYDGMELNNYFPHVVFVHNRAFSNHFTPKNIEELQSIYQAALADSGLCLESQIGICSGTFSPPLALSSSSFHINLFMVPDFHYQENCPVTFADALWEMRRQIFSLGRCPLTHVTLTEKTWYQYACRMWETIRKSSLYMEYSRLLP